MAKEQKKNKTGKPADPYADFQRIEMDGNIYKQMFKYSVIPIIIHDMEMNIIHINDSAVEQFGYSREELLERTIFDLHAKEELEHAKKVLNEMQKEEKMVVETRFIRKDGSVFIAEATPCKFLLDNIPVIHVYIQDITDRKRAEKELNAFNRELQIKNKELEQFAYIASHDLQEPLHTVNSFVALLEEEYKGKLDKDGNQSLQYIAEASSHMRNLVKGLLDYSRLGNRRELVEIDCNKLLESVQKNLAALIAETGATFDIGQLPTVQGYETELHLLFQNLITNAIKFRKDGITPHIVIQAKKDQDWIFTVQDNGIGIDKKHLDKIFVIFQRLHAKSRYDGTGIGLAHCRKIVHLHGGKIWVDSQPNAGSTFCFTLPA